METKWRWTIIARQVQRGKGLRRSMEEEECIGSAVQRCTHLTIVDRRLLVGCSDLLCSIAHLSPPRFASVARRPHHPHCTSNTTSALHCSLLSLSFPLVLLMPAVFD